MLSAVLWMLHRRPELGRPTAAPDVFAQTTEPLLGVPELVIYYEFDEHTVTLLEIHRADHFASEYPDPFGGEPDWDPFATDP